MTRSSKKGKRKKQKAGLNKSILDVGMGMLRSAIEYKVKGQMKRQKHSPTGLVVETQTSTK
jgi:putative transposase